MQLKTEQVFAMAVMHIRLYYIFRKGFYTFHNQLTIIIFKCIHRETCICLFLSTHNTAVIESNYSKLNLVLYIQQLTKKLRLVLTFHCNYL